MTTLEALNSIKRYVCTVKDLEAFNIIETALKIQDEYIKDAEKEHEELEYLKSIGTQKKLKALEIIENKKLIKNGLFINVALKKYNRYAIAFGEEPLTKEEYDLLKEELCLI